MSVTERLRETAARLSLVPATFRRDQRGVVALMFGLMLLPMLGALGLAIDFGNIMMVRSQAQMAADAAALQASGVARDLIKEKDGGDITTKAAIDNAKARALKLFTAHAEQSKIKDYTVDVDVKRTGQILTTTVTFSVKTVNYIGKIFGRDRFTAVGESVSTSTLPNYSDVYLALDISGSMGIAATQAEMVKLFNAKGKRVGGGTQATGCVFGCHVIESGWTESFSTLASRLGVRLRIDVLRDAVKNMIATAEDDADAAPIYRIALYTMGASLDASTWSMNPVAPLTNNFTALKAAANTIDIATPPITAPQMQNSYINEQLDSIKNVIPKSEDGTSQSKSKKYLFLITDGARDVPPGFGSCTKPGGGSGRCVNGINAAYCKALKDKGITVGVLYTTYVPVAKDPANPTGPLEQWFKLEMVDTGAYAKIQPALKDCASPDWFYEASDADGIDSAMAKMFAQTTQAPTLTN